MLLLLLPVFIKGREWRFYSIQMTDLFTSHFCPLTFVLSLLSSHFCPLTFVLLSHSLVSPLSSHQLPGGIKCRRQGWVRLSCVTYLICTTWIYLIPESSFQSQVYLCICYSFLTCRLLHYSHPYADGARAGNLFRPRAWSWGRDSRFWDSTRYISSPNTRA